ncbi:MAG: hypothetical protein QF570_05780 [Myxococcota bacterium]|jgi:hypothetical protein|nr:hypothetical protein [Myxococcota bacterium]
MLEEAIVRRRPLLGHETRRTSIQGHAIARDEADIMGLAETPLRIRNQSENEVSVPVDSLIRVSGHGAGHELRFETLAVEVRSQHVASLVLTPMPAAPETPPEMPDEGNWWSRAPHNGFFVGPHLGIIHAISNDTSGRKQLRDGTVLRTGAVLGWRYLWPSGWNVGLGAGASYGVVLQRDDCPSGFECNEKDDGVMPRLIIDIGWGF